MTPRPPVPWAHRQRQWEVFLPSGRTSDHPAVSSSPAGSPGGNRHVGRLRAQGHCPRPAPSSLRAVSAPGANFKKREQRAGRHRGAGRRVIPPAPRRALPAPTWPPVAGAHGVADLAQVARITAPPEIAVVRARDARQAPQKPEAPERGQTAAAPRHLHGESAALRALSAAGGLRAPAPGSRRRARSGAPLSWTPPGAAPARPPQPSPLSSQLSVRPPPYQQDKILRNRIIDASFSKLPRNSHNPSNKNGMSTLNFILTSVPLR